MTDHSYSPFPPECNEKSDTSRIEILETAFGQLLSLHATRMQAYEKELQSMKNQRWTDQRLLVLWALLNVGAILKLLYDQF
jgi:hypothetical protein